MNAIEFIDISEDLEFQRTGYVSPNLFKIANQNIFDDYVMPFFVPRFLTALEDLYLYEVTINNATGATTLTKRIKLDKTNYSALYYQGEIPITKMTIGRYYCVVIENSVITLLITKNIFKCVKGYSKVTAIKEFEIVDYEGDTFEDNTGDTFVEKY